MKKQAQIEIIEFQDQKFEVVHARHKVRKLKVE